ncbi:MAG: topoisomerase C-terminal repeat-containing protein, partial [Alphaproteobacteria bacterium]
GRFGPYLKHGSTFKSLGAGDDVLTVGLNRAVDLLAQAAARGRAPGRVLGDHPADGKPITVHAGRYGPYVQHGKVNATVPRGTDPDTLTVEAAVALLAERAARAPAARGRRTKVAPERAAAAKAAPEASATKKPATRKAAKKTAATKSAPAKSGKTKAAPPKPRAKAPAGKRAGPGADG